MDIIQQRRTMNALAIALIAGAGGAAYWSVSDLGSMTPPGESDRKVVTASSDEDFQKSAIKSTDVAMRSLRSPLYDPPPEPPSPAAIKPPSRPPAPRPASSSKLNLTLVGTIIDSQQRVAILSDASGKFDIKSAGESLELSPDGIVITAIDSEQVTLTYRGQESILELDRDATAMPAAAGRIRPTQRRRNQ